MSSVSDEEIFDRFLARRGHDVPESWDQSYNKLQCPECGGLHDHGATRCAVCGWHETDAN